MIARRLKSIPRNERGFSDFSLGHCDSFPCYTNTRYVLGPNKSVVSAVSSGRRHDSAVTPRLSRAHPRNIYQRAIHDGTPGRRASLITAAARCRAVLILRPRCAARQLLTRQCTCIRAHVCVPMDINPWTWSRLERTRLGMQAYRARNLYHCMENEIPDE